MFWYGPDRIDGIFFDTGAVRGSINYSPEEEDRDISSHTMLSTYTKNLYRDHVLGERDENCSADGLHMSDFCSTGFNYEGLDPHTPDRFTPSYARCTTNCRTSLTHR